MLKTIASLHQFNENGDLSLIDLVLSHRFLL